MVCPPLNIREHTMRLNAGYWQPKRQKLKFQLISFAAGNFCVSVVTEVRWGFEVGPILFGLVHDPFMMLMMISVRSPSYFPPNANDATFLTIQVKIRRPFAGDHSIWRRTRLVSKKCVNRKVRWKIRSVLSRKHVILALWLKARENSQYSRSSFFSCLERF